MKQIRRVLLGSAMVLVLGISSIGIKAEENVSNGDKNQETDFSIKVTETDIEEPGDGEDGGDGNTDIKGKLAIWLKPSRMDFSGKYNELINYQLELNEGDLGYRRLAVADVRANEEGWELKAKLSDLEETKEDNTKGSKISSGYAMSMTYDLGTYAFDDDGKVIKNKIDYANDNGVEAVKNEDDRIVITKDSNTVFKTVSDYQDGVAGKGYTAAKLKDIQIEFEAGKGLAGDFKGQVEWTLSSTVK